MYLVVHLDTNVMYKHRQTCQPVYAHTSKLTLKQDASVTKKRTWLKILNDKLHHSLDCYQSTGIPGVTMKRKTDTTLTSADTTLSWGLCEIY